MEWGKTLDISIDTEKAFDKVQHPFMKTAKIQKTRNGGELAQHDKRHLQKSPQLASHSVMKDKTLSQISGTR
jgi:hypothetical protein